MDHIGLPASFDVCVQEVLRDAYPTIYTGIANGLLPVTIDYLTAEMYHAVNSTEPLPAIDTLFTVVNFGLDSGFVVYALDYGIVALSNNGHIDISDYVHPTYKEYDDSFDPRDELFSLIDMSAYFMIKYDSLLNLPHFDPVDTGMIVIERRVVADDSLLEYYGPYVKMNMNQDYPINKYCPACTSGVASDGGHAAAGCGPIALAMVFSCHNYPRKIRGRDIDWNAVVSGCATYPLRPYDTTQIDILADCVERLGDIARTTYDCDSGSGTYCNNMSLTFACYFGKYRDVKWSVIDKCGNEYVRYVKEKKPVVFFSSPAEDSNGSSHFFVADGYGAVVRTIEKKYADGEVLQFDSTKYTLIHCNFGWGGYCNGYYRYEQGFDLDKGPDAISKKVNDVMSKNKNCIYSRNRRALLYNLR